MTGYFIVKYLHVLGAIVILGTGGGIAFFMLMAHRSGDAAFIARTAATVVIADMLFTLSAVVLQPITGGVLMMLSSTRSPSPGWSPRSGFMRWPGCSGFRWCSCRSKCATWRARPRRSGAPLPPRYFALFRRWFMFGIPGFGSVMAILWLMIAKPGFEASMSEADTSPNILVLGASGLIGRFVTDDLRVRGFAGHRRGAADSRPRSRQRVRYRTADPVDGCAALAQLMRIASIDLVVNCLGVLQDGPGSDTKAVHRDFVARLLQAIGECGRAMRLSTFRFPAMPTATTRLSPPPSARPSA